MIANQVREQLMRQNTGRIGMLMAFLSSMIFACTAKTPVTTPEVVSDTQRDIGHEHQHIHGSGQVHEHDHPDGFEGAHSHEHEHGHRHGEPLHGGRIVEIKTVDERNLGTHFHAEVLPMLNGRLSFHLLTETSDGGFEDFPIEAQVIPAMASPVPGTQVGSNESARDDSHDTRDNLRPSLEFLPQNEAGPSSEFTCSLPTELMSQPSIMIRIPELLVGGEGYTLLFQVSADRYSEQGPSTKPQNEPIGN